MSFTVVVQVNGDALHVGDLYYEKRKLYRVENVGKQRGSKRTFTVMFRLIGKIDLSRQAREEL